MTTTRCLVVLFVFALVPIESARAQGVPPPLPPSAAPLVTTPTATAPGIQPPAANPYPYGQPMQTGGLNAPAPFAQDQQRVNAHDPPPATSYDSELEESKQKDSGRGLTWFWLEADGGFEHVGLHTFNAKDENLSAGFIDTEASGGTVGGGLGARFFVFTVGARGRMGFFDAWQLGRIGGELGLHFPIGIFEPHVDVGGGYAALGNFDGIVPEQIDVHGGYARATAGLDLYPVSQLSFGASASFDFMALTRPGLSEADLTALQSQNAITPAQAGLLAVDGSGYGATFAITGVVGLHL
jgi:hypothetical protein